MLSVSLPESLVKAIEAERATIKPMPSRNAMIGFLLEVGLEARRALSRESQISSTR
jgi:metal-responsive CopG/Arc/MetJ family transcriptional regulator